jgi:hypothetical protein
MKQMKSINKEEISLLDKLNEILQEKKLPDNLNLTNLELELENNKSEFIKNTRKNKVNRRESKQNLKDNDDDIDNNKDNDIFINYNYDKKIQQFSSKKSNSQVALKDNNSNASQSSILKIDNMSLRGKSNNYQIIKSKLNSNSNSFTEFNNSEKVKYLQSKKNKIEPEDYIEDNSKQNLHEISQRKNSIII